MFVHQLEPARKLYQHCIDINIYILICVWQYVYIDPIPSSSIKWQHQPWQSHWRLRRASFVCKEVQSLISHSPNTSTIYLIDISHSKKLSKVLVRKWVENQQQPSPSSVFFTIFDFCFHQKLTGKKSNLPPSPYHHPTGNLPASIDLCGQGQMHIPPTATQTRLGTTWVQQLAEATKDWAAIPGKPTRGRHEPWLTRWLIKEGSLRKFPKQFEC